MPQTTGIPGAELGTRRERLLEHVRREGLTGYVLFDQHYIRYFTSFGFLATERPVAFVQSETAEMAVFVPESRSSACGRRRASNASSRTRSTRGSSIRCASSAVGYFMANDLLPLWKQHTGHAIGLRNHEAPFLDVGDHTLIEPGMVFTVEPGVYSSEVGGFRHSDTVVITDDGIEVLTDYPRDIESLTIPE